MHEQQPFGSLLKRFRLAAGLTHEDLAERANVSVRAISDLERGVNRYPRQATLALLIEALQLSPVQRDELIAAARRNPLSHSASMDAGTLPVQLTSFVGRESETRLGLDLLRRPEIRLITLTGPGGVGKTRLGVQLTADIAGLFADGVRYVPLAPVTDVNGVLAALGQALTPDGTAVYHTREDVLAFLRDREMLLLLDNCEHLPDAVPLLSELLRRCPRLRLLATSREPLRLSGEQELPVEPLAVPETSQFLTTSQLLTYPAVALFVERATRVRPEFVLTPENAMAVTGICVRLDGLPLALELAAARLRLLPPQALFDRLTQATGEGFLHLLSEGARDAPPRQQTLAATLSWSYDLLNPVEQQLLRQLAVFVGGCTLDAIEEVCGPALTETRAQRPVVAVLASLVDKSLVAQVAGIDGDPRYTLLETIREFALERLLAAGEQPVASGRHARYYLTILEETGALLFADAPKRARHAAEQHNIQAALRWLVREG